MIHPVVLVRSSNQQSSQPALAARFDHSILIALLASRFKKGSQVLVLTALTPMNIIGLLIRPWSICVDQAWITQAPQQKPARRHHAKKKSGMTSAFPMSAYGCNLDR
jgi:hypothetical protein